MSEPGLINANYRVYQPLATLARRGHEVRTNHEGRVIGDEELLACDVLHVHRIATPEMQQLACRLREAGVGIVWDNDDDVTAVPRTNPLYARLGGFRSRDMRVGVRAMMGLADVVTTTSPVLAEQYRELGAVDVRVLENFVPTEFGKVRPAKHRGVVIGYVAGLEHQADYQALGLRDTLARLIDAHPDLRVMSIGLGLGLPQDRYEHRPSVEFRNLAKALARCDIGIAPLIDTAFNRARSNAKLKEYASGGLPWLASPIGPYAGMGEQQGGRLVPDDGWYDALERLIVNARERRKLAKRAARWVRAERIDQHIHRWEVAMRDAVERAQARSAGTRAVSA
jgi:glycosyltransferase involved in cell wall biosynthesis